MASAIGSNPGDAFIHLHSDEHSALLALLYGLQDEDLIKTIADEKNIELSTSQCARIATLWRNLATSPVR